MGWSVVIPRIGAVHCNGLMITGISKCCSGGTVLHYEHKNLVAITRNNSLGEPNHYLYDGNPIGYTRKRSRTKVVHYNRKGRPIGYSRCLLFIWTHHGRITKEGWIL